MTAMEQKPQWNIIARPRHLKSAWNTLFEQQGKESETLLDTNIALTMAAKQTNHLNISSNKDQVLLSCKGLASKSKVKEFYRCQVVNGQKMFECVWTNCSFSTRSSPRIASHINLSHIGVQLKCPKANCCKVFKSPNTYREHLKNHICGFGLFGYGSKNVLAECNNTNINKYRQKLSIRSKRFWRCVFEVEGSECGSISKYQMAIKRHIHAHICPYRKNLRLLQNKRLIRQMKSQSWNVGNIDHRPDSCGKPSDRPNNATDEKNVITDNTYQCRRLNCTQQFNSSADLLKHEEFFCPFVNNGKRRALKTSKTIGKVMPKISTQELALCEDPTPPKEQKVSIKRNDQKECDRRGRPRKPFIQNNVQGFRSSSRILNKIIKNKQQSYAEPSSESEMSIDSNDSSNTSLPPLQVEANHSSNLNCDVSSSQVNVQSIGKSMSELINKSSGDSHSMNQSICLTHFLKEKPILKQTMDTLIEYGVDAQEVFNTLNWDQMNDCEDTNNQITDSIDETLLKLSDVKFPYFKELFNKEIIEKQRTESGLKHEVKEFEMSIELIESVLKQAIDSEIRQLKTALL